MRHIAIDLDGTLCTETSGQYRTAKPLPERIAWLNALYDAGDYIRIDTGRHGRWRHLTVKQLTEWGVKHHELRIGKKKHADQYVDVTATHPDDFFAGHADRWPDGYFAQRIGNDPKRQTSFWWEERFLVTHGVPWDGRVCDVGCSTGEFLSYIRWAGPRFGMEISALAREIARSTCDVSFDRDIMGSADYFDLVVFRGTIQHLPRPFQYIDRAFQALKPGGYVAFLATPNTGSLCYRLWQELPVSDDPRNYWMPSAKTLSNALRNAGFEVVATEYPYRNGGYARPFRDVLSFARRLTIGGKTNFPFPGNMMNLIARKP